MLYTPSILRTNLFNDLFDDDLFTRPFSHLDSFQGNAGELMRTDVREDKDSYELQMSLPGIDKKDIKASLKDGYMTIKVKTPCLVTCIKELNTPRYMTVTGIFDTYSKPMTVLDYEALKDNPLIDKSTIGLSGSPTNILTSFTPPQKGAGMMLEGNDMKTCEQLAGFLSEKHYI